MNVPMSISPKDALLMSFRSLKISARQPDAVIVSLLLPVILMLLFVYVLGGAMDVGVDYIQYVVPGILVVCAGYGAGNTAVSIATDLQNGAIDRFRSMPIRSTSIIIGHIVASLTTNVIATAMALSVAWLAGFRPSAEPAEWLGVAGLLLLFVLAISWAAATAGLLLKTVEATNGATLFMLFMPYLSSAFAPTDTMPTALQGVAQHQPFTPLIDALRALLLGQPVGNSAIIATAWFGGILILSYVAARWIFEKRTT